MGQVQGLQMIAFREGQNLLNLLWPTFQGKVKTRLEDNQYSEVYLPAGLEHVYSECLS